MPVFALADAAPLSGRVRQRLVDRCRVSLVRRNDQNLENHSSRLGNLPSQSATATIPNLYRYHCSVLPEINRVCGKSTWTESSKREFGRKTFQAVHASHACRGPSKFTPS